MLKSAAFFLVLSVIFVAGMTNIGFGEARELRALGQSVHPHDVMKFVSNRVIFVLKPGSDPEAVAREHGLVADYVYKNALVGFSAKVSSDRLDVLGDDRLIAAENDQIFTISKVQYDPSWSLDRVDQRRLPLNKTYSYKNAGKGVSIYIMDTGIRLDHREFEGRAVKGFDSYGGDGVDCNGHGSHVAGIAAGSSYGIAKEASLYSVKVMTCGGTGSNSAILSGIDWVIANRNIPAIANFSISGGKSTVLDDAVKKLAESGVTVVVAAGNGAEDACEHSPGRASEVMTIGATDRTDRRWGLSNFGSCVTLFAPGHQVPSVGITTKEASATMSGTSMAAPMVAGAAAQFLEIRPEALPKEVSEALVHGATQGVVEDSKSPSRALVYVRDGSDVLR